jgi:ribonuclease E
MLIDAAHPEETRVVVTSGTRLEEFDFESSTKRQVKGNIYLAKVTRVEPSLQAAFVDYGGNRHGFLAFSEIHPDYYRIPVSDRPGEAEPQLANGHAAAPDLDNDTEDTSASLAAVLPEPVPLSATANEDDAASEDDADDDEAAAEPASDRGGDSAPFGDVPEEERVYLAPFDVPSAAIARPEPQPPGEFAEESEELGAEPSGELAVIALRAAEEAFVVEDDAGEAAMAADADRDGAADDERQAVLAESVETLGGDEVEEVEEADAEQRRAYHPARHYKIQEVIKRRQIMLVQVAKEERGNKGAALTTYLSLAGRYCVLMPNTNRGGGVSRKITSITDRRRLKDIVEDLEIPEGMGVIVRTAGAERSRAEIKRDYEYLLRLWNEIRELTLKSTAPALIYEEGNLIKRSIRDLYTRDIDEVLVEGEEGYKTAKAFMRTLMPSHAKRVQPYRDPQVGLFHRFQIESQIDAVHSPVAQLRSGGYVVINQTEALVAIDVNSGRATRERNIEETATRTNLEAAEEIARQLRLRDLAGLIVIDFIDMEEHRNQMAVERRLKDALKNERARIQVGRISPFGLLEMSRQRLRPSLAEASTQPCPHCGGTGFIRSVESTALYVLRSIEEEGSRRRSAEICIYVPTNVALYILNQKRESLAQIEARYGVKVLVARDDTLIPPAFRLERLRAYITGEAPLLRPIQAPTLADEDEEEDIEDTAEAPAEATEETDAEQGGEDERGRRRRPRRRRRTKEQREARPAAAPEPAAPEPPVPAAAEGSDAEREAENERRHRRRGRRGGRRPRREDAAEDAAPASAAETIEILPAVAEPTGEADDLDGESLPPLETWAAEADIETASLAPFAGDGMSSPPEQPLTAVPEAPPSAEAEAGIPFESAAERELEDAVATLPEAEPPAASSHPGEDVLTVTEKPDNPRRGWWQRLIQ